MRTRNVIIMGAAGRDFHNFNVGFRNNPRERVVAFTAAQIPNIGDRTYPPELAGPLYPTGVPIYPESRLVELVREYHVDEVIHAYSDVSHETVMHAASIAIAAGADFRIMGPRSTCMKSTKPVIAVCAVRTGAGKSPTSQFVVNVLRAQGLRVGVVRHPMPYGDLVAMEVQRFATYEDFASQDATIEEREEYEPYVRKGIVVWAGVDYEKILRQAEKESDIILWDGGNNDLPFFFPDLHITLVDPHRPGHELAYHPGEANLRSADVVLITKIDTAPAEAIRQVLKNIKQANPEARVFRSRMVITGKSSDAIRGKKVIVVEDGPTLTHGGMGFGAGAIFAKDRGAKIVDAALYAVGSIRKLYTQYPHLDKVLPAMGYGARQVRALQTTINRADADLVVDATPVDLGRLIKINKPILEVGYALQPSSSFKRLLKEFGARGAAGVQTTKS